MFRVCQTSINQKNMFQKDHNKIKESPWRKNDLSWMWLRQEKEGATIVEVAVIVPMILIVIMVCVFLLFFFLDMGVTQSESIYIAMMWPVNGDKLIISRSMKKKLY